MDDDKLIIQDVQTAQPVATEPIHRDRGGSEKPSRACMWEQWWAQQALSKSCTDHRRDGAGKGIFLWNEVFCFQIGFFVICWYKSVEYEGALQLQTKCNLLKACKIETEGVKRARQIEYACRVGRNLTPPKNATVARVQE